MILTQKAKDALAGVAQWLEAGAPHREDKMIDGFNINTGIESSYGCGTTCCIAGALVQFNNPVDAKIYGNVSWDKILDDALNILDLSADDKEEIAEAKILFGVGDIEEYNIHEYRTDDDGEEIEFNPTPEQAALVIRNLIATGEVDWSIIDD